MFTIKPSKYTEFLGWYGMIALIGAYSLASFGMIVAEGLTFQALNLSGGLAMIIYATSKKATRLATLNIFWVLIGAIAIWRLFLG